MNEKEQNRETMADAEPAQEPVDEVAQSPEPVEDEVAFEDLATQLEELAIARDNLAAENVELRQQLLRRQADFDNLRRRVENERADFTRYAAMETVGALLPLIDDFERALEAAQAAEGAEDDFIKGIEIIYNRFVSTLEKAGLEAIKSVGNPFDPNFHHAVETVPTDEFDDHTVIEEYRKGYNFKGKLLREAMVKVSVRPSDSAGATDSE